MFKLASHPLDICLRCRKAFVGVEGKLIVVTECDNHRRTAAICADCAQTSMAEVA